uniref:hypothetical protein n=1 Tax=Halomonas sp. TaxID=1486246 RepID=UPI002607CCC5|nr:hypothetical protein [Halomonas sp.]
MIDRGGVDQNEDQVIDIVDWPTSGTHGVYPVGARDKSLRLCPDPAPQPFCIPRHRYLFKEAIKSAKQPGRPRHPAQYWSEAIAFRIGRLMKLSLPPVFVAIDSDSGEPGTINEWFMDYPGQEGELYIAGGDLMQHLIPGYDRDKGRQHNFGTIQRLALFLYRTGRLTHSWEEYWGLCLCFDALIGNTDRHQENWGLIVTPDGKSVRFSPYFDNGTSLGHELLPEVARRKMRDPNEFAAYLRKGEHHMRWSLHDRKRLRLIEGVERFGESYPEVKDLLINRLRQWDEEDLWGILSGFTKFTDMPAPFTQENAEFVQFLTLARRERLIQALET